MPDVEVKKNSSTFSLSRLLMAVAFFATCTACLSWMRWLISSSPWRHDYLVSLLVLSCPALILGGCVCLRKSIRSAVITTAVAYVGTVLFVAMGLSLLNAAYSPAPRASDWAVTIRGILNPRGHYYSLEYRNRSAEDIFVHGVGDLRASKKGNSGRRVVHGLPRRIVWWQGGYRKPRRLDSTFSIIPPKNLQLGDCVVFTLNSKKVWKTSIE